MITLERFGEKIKSTTKFKDIYNFVVVDKQKDCLVAVYKFLFDMPKYRIYMIIDNDGDFRIVKVGLENKLEDEFDITYRDCIPCLIEDTHVDVTIKY